MVKTKELNKAFQRLAPISPLIFHNHCFSCKVHLLAIPELLEFAISSYNHWILFLHAFDYAVSFA